MKRHCFIGRFQPFHKGHEWLIRQKLEEGPVLILIRDIPPDEKNPLTAEQVKRLIDKNYETLTILEAMSFTEPEDLSVEVMVIPDIASVNYGRGVGYDVIEHTPPEDIETISATEIRRRIKEGNPSWKNFVPRQIHSLLEEFLG